MSSLPPVADPTATMPAPVTSTTPVVSGIVVATPISTTATAPTTIVTTTVAPPPPAITVVRTAPVLTTVPVLSAQAPVYVPVPVTSHVTTSSTVVKQLPVVATTLVPTISKSSSSSSKGSKKKAASAAAAAAAIAAATVTMATAATAQSSGANGGAQGENTGRWTSEEHNLFLQGLELHGKGWKKIAGLIKSRTVVQIRTHAQKYFQKLAKAKQNGEDVGGSNAGVGNAISMMMMEGRSNGGGSNQVSNGHNGNNIPSSSTSGSVYGSIHTNKRRKQTTGTKRKAIQSVVASARRDKKIATTASTQYDYPVGVAPALAPYILPFDVTSSNTTQQSGTVGSGTQSQGNTPLEDSLFRYLTPTSIHPPETQVNPVALQAGANPITLPTSKTANTLAGGEISPTGVSDFELYPSWTDFSKEAPSWYAKGSDVDALLDVADSLDWLTDTGDLTEVYEEAERMDAVNNTTVDPSQAPMQKEMMVPVGGGTHYDSSNNIASSMSTNTLPRIDSGAQVVCVPHLPSLFGDDGVTDGSDDPDSHKERGIMSSAPSVAILDEHLFSSPIEESDFVSCIMNDTSSSATLSAMALDTSS